MPQNIYGTSKRLLYLEENSFKITSNMKVNCDIIEENKAIYIKNLFNTKHTSNPKNESLITELNIEIKFSNICPDYPNSEMDESCKNEINLE